MRIEGDPRQDQVGAGARAVASAAEALCATAGDGEAETARRTLSCPDERLQPARDFCWLIEAGCCSVSLLKKRNYVANTPSGRNDAAKKISMIYCLEA
jgi:hypothetical protein